MRSMRTPHAHDRPAPEPRQLAAQLERQHNPCNHPDNIRAFSRRTIAQSAAAADRAPSCSCAMLMHSRPEQEAKCENKKMAGCEPTTKRAIACRNEAYGTGGVRITNPTKLFFFARSLW